MSEDGHEQRYLFQEQQGKYTFSSTTLDAVLVRTKSQYQRIDVIRQKPYGTTLVLDGATQSAALDESVYHEALVQPAMLAHPNPRRVLIGGGGEMASAREVLKHNTVEQCVMVDLDKKVVDVCKKHLPQWHQRVYEDKRLEIRIGDVLEYVREANKKGEHFDVIIMDICDPFFGEAYVAYTQEFYTQLRTLLNPKGGIFVTQATDATDRALMYERSFAIILNTMRTVFRHCYGYRTLVSSFFANWAFAMGVRNLRLDPDHDGLNNVHPDPSPSASAEAKGGGALGQKGGAQGSDKSAQNKGQGGSKVPMVDAMVEQDAEELPQDKCARLNYGALCMPDRRTLTELIESRLRWTLPAPEFSEDTPLGETFTYSGKQGSQLLRFYDWHAHLSMFHLSKTEKRLIYAARGIVARAGNDSCYDTCDDSYEEQVEKVKNGSSDHATVHDKEKAALVMQESKVQ